MNPFRKGTRTSTIRSFTAILQVNNNKRYILNTGHFWLWQEIHYYVALLFNWFWRFGQTKNNIFWITNLSIIIERISNACLLIRYDVRLIQQKKRLANKAKRGKNKSSASHTRASRDYYRKSKTIRFAFVLWL